LKWSKKSLEAMAFVSEKPRRKYGFVLELSNRLCHWHDLMQG
jgi:hypothetical protein